jgi:sporadic carbohydrate cluster protein (TIGR04323 family)
MKSLPKMNLLKPYVTNKKFGPYYLPVRFQNKLLRQYCEEKNKIFSLPTGEITFGDSYIQLRSLIKDIKKNEGLLFISTYILPKDNKFRNEIINNISKKNIECHFIFENLICKSKNDFKKINVFFKLRNFTNS